MLREKLNHVLYDPCTGIARILARDLSYHNDIIKLVLGMRLRGNLVDFIE